MNQDAPAQSPSAMPSAAVPRPTHPPSPPLLSAGVMLAPPDPLRHHYRRGVAAAAFATPLVTNPLLRRTVSLQPPHARPSCPPQRHHQPRTAYRRATAPASPRCSGAVYEDEDGRRVVPVELFVSATEGTSVSGVYAVHSEDGGTEFISLSRDVRESLLRLRQHVTTVSPATASTQDLYAVRVLTFRTPVPNLMAQVAHDWVSECDDVPRGNAQGWPEHDADLSARADWPPVYAARVEPFAHPGAAPVIVSPFAGDASGGANSDAAVAVATAAAAAGSLELTEANVDAALEEVRPYLLADGGNIRVTRVDAASGEVDVVLEGACGGCASAGTTMREGVEKVLRARFGDALTAVTAVQEGGGADGMDPGYADIVSKTACERALEPIQGVLRGLGAHVRVVEVDEDEVVVSFSGPNNLRLGVETQLLERVSGLEVVTFEDPS